MNIILHFIKKEFHQFKRDPKMFALILIAPVIQLVFLGYAATLDVKDIRTAVFDMNRSAESREFVRKFSETEYFQIDKYVTSYDEIEELIDNGEIMLGLVIPSDFSSNIYKNIPAEVQAIFEGSDGNTAGIAAGYMQSIVSDYAAEIIVQSRASKGNKFMSIPSVDAEIRVWYNPEMKTRNFMVPGIVGLLLMIITLILTSLAIVKEKEIGTMEQLIVTPIKPYHLIVGKLVPFTIVGLASVVVVLTAMKIVFGIGVRGSTTFLFFSTFIYVLSLLGFGLFISTISKTQQQAMMLAIFVVMLPMIYLSGFAFPIENMPKTIQYITYIIPLRYFITIIRGIILKGIGFAELWDELLILFLMGVTILYLSSRRFRKRLE